MVGSDSDLADGALELRVGHDGPGWVISLGGEFDLSALHTVETQIDEALRDERGGAVVIDLSELEFIDSTGVSVLFTAIRRDRARRLRFIPSDSRAVTRVFDLTGLSRQIVPDGGG